MAVSDKELRGLLRELDSNSTVDEITARLTLQDMAPELARELLAARKVVKAARRWRGYMSNATENKLVEAVRAYDKARKVSPPPASDS